MPSDTLLASPEPDTANIPQSGSNTPGSLLPALLCALALAACVAIARPILEMGFDDDWSYIWSARDLLNTGHIIYNGWTTAMLGWQLYLGALFIKLFGFSFTTIRISILLVSMATAALLQRLFVRLGLNPSNAVIATLTIVLSPLFLPLSFSFMSDVPGLFSLLLCIFLCLRAIQARTGNAAIAWLAVAALSNAASGTVRQVAWLGVLIVVPSTAWYMRRRRGALLAGALLWLVSAAAIEACMHWSKAQPYFLNENLLARALNREGIEQLIVSLVRGASALCLLLLPVLVAFLFKSPRTTPRTRTPLIASTACFVLSALGFGLFAQHRLSHNQSVHEITPFSRNLVSSRGLADMPILLGHRPEIIPVGVRIALISLILAAALACILTIRLATRSKSPTPPRPGQLSAAALFALLGPFTAVYMVLLVTREEIYDRYLLPLLFVLLVYLLRFYQDKIAERLPALSTAVLVLVAAFSTAAMHDLFAMDRARLAAANEMLAAGVPRSQFRVGFEYDSWTQLQLSGYVNDQRLKVPAGAYRPYLQPDAQTAPCVFWFTDHTPDVHARFGLSFDPGTCPPSQFAPVSYDAWIAPHHVELYIHQLP